MIDSEKNITLSKETPKKPVYEKPELSIMSTDQTEVGAITVSESAPFGS